MKKFLMMLALVLAFCCFTACKKEFDTIRVGTSGPLTGDNEVYGKTVKMGMDLAIKEINASGGVKVGDTNKNIELVGFINDEADPDRAKQAFNTLYDQGLHVYLGAVTSGATNGAVSEAIKTGIPVITPTGTADNITVGANGDEREERSNVFRACYNDSYQGYVMAKFSESQGYKKVAIIYNNEDPYSKGLYDAFVKTVTDENLGIEYSGFEYQNNTANFNSFFGQNTVNDTYDAVYVPDYYQKVSLIIRAGREANYTKPFLGCDGWDGINTVDNFDDTLLEGCFFSNHFAVDSTETKVKNFVTAYNAEYGVNPTSLAALGYDVVYIMKEAIENAGSLDYDKVVAALSSSDFLAACISGDITFDANGNPKKAAAVMTFDSTGTMKFFKSQE